MSTLSAMSTGKCYFFNVNAFTLTISEGGADIADSVDTCHKSFPSKHLRVHTSPYDVHTVRTYGTL